jgi:hypothetical protein
VIFVGIDGIVNMELINIIARFVVDVESVFIRKINLHVRNAVQILFVLMVNNELSVLHVLEVVHVNMGARDIDAKYVHHYLIYIILCKQKQ